jgi:aminoglycoside 2'-N-acetyltransferase I
MAPVAEDGSRRAPHPATPRLRRLRTDELAPAEAQAVRDLLRAAFADDGGGFSEDDWAHSTGGIHVVLDVDGVIVAHAALVARSLQADGGTLRTGYVEGVATAPGHQGRGYGTLVMREIGALIAAEFELGALSTGVPAFYERLGWRRWLGPTFVATRDGVVATPEDDGGILFLPTASGPPLDPAGPIACDSRKGDPW